MGILSSGLSLWGWVEGRGPDCRTASDRKGRKGQYADRRLDRAFTLTARAWSSQGKAGQ